jgi:anti-anti-sigma factor
MPIQMIPYEQESHLLLSGEFGLLDVEQIKTDLTRALESARRVIIDMQELSHIDVACLQLICSAHQSALSAGKELILSPRQPEVFRRQVARSGLISQDSNDSSDKKDCFWNGEDR